MTFQVRLMLMLPFFFWYNWSLQPSLCEQSLNPWQQRRIQAFATQVMSCGEMPGLSLSIVRGSSNWTLPMGVVNVSSQVPVQNETRFAIGSLTKAMTSTLLVSLLKRSHRWSVDTPLVTILGNSHLFADDLRSQQATVKDILSHRLGLARADLALFAGYPTNFSLADLSRSLSCLPEQEAFRSGYTYSNILYSLAGHVIERLANQSFTDALRSRFLGPLGMSSTRPYSPVDSHEYGGTGSPRPDVDSYSMAVPYVFVKDQLLPADPRLFRNIEPFLPALGLASNGPDMVRWLRLQLGTGSGLFSDDAESMFPRSVISSTHEPVTPHIVNNLRPRFPQPDLTFAYGLGWNQAVYKGFRRAWHSGSLFGFNSQIWLFQDLGLGMFVAVNGPLKSPHTQNRLSALLFYVTDLMLGDKPWLDEVSACSYPSPPPDASPPMPGQPSQSRHDNRNHQRIQISAKGSADRRVTRQEAIDNLLRSSRQLSHERHTAHLLSTSSYPPLLTSSPSLLKGNKSLKGQGNEGLLSLSSLLSSDVAAKNTIQLKISEKEKKHKFLSTFKTPSTIHNDCLKNMSTLSKDLQLYTGVFFNNLIGKVSVTHTHVHVCNETNRKKSNDTSAENTDVRLENDEKSNTIRPRSKSKGWLYSNLRILFGEKFSGVLVHYEGRQNFADISRSSVRSFEMIPTGIFEFTSYFDEEYVTMPVQFSEFDTNGVPKVLKAIWQREEVLKFTRDPSTQNCGLRFKDMTNNSAFQFKMFTFQILFLSSSIVLIVYTCNLNLFL